MSYFVLLYDQLARSVMRLEEFPNEAAEAALARRLELQQDNIEHPEIEVVLLGAQSEDDLRRTHGRYFKSMEELTSVG